MNREEIVVLVDEQNNVLGIKLKKEVHQKDTPLHRGFSIFIFNNDKKLLLQQRSSKKKTWPLIWSNSCCGHPGLDESNIDAVKRRVKYELGFVPDNIEEISPYRYTVSKDGVMENEICPIFMGLIKESSELKMNKDEIESIRWISWIDFLEEIKNSPEKFSPWCIEEVEILKKNKRFCDII